MARACLEQDGWGATTDAVMDCVDLRQQNRHRRALHVQRQSLYQRLGKIFELLGDPAPGSPEYGGLAVAVELARRMIQDANGM